MCMVSFLSHMIKFGLAVRASIPSLPPNRKFIYIFPQSYTREHTEKSSDSFIKFPHLNKQWVQSSQSVVIFLNYTNLEPRKLENEKRNYLSWTYFLSYLSGMSNSSIILTELMLLIPLQGQHEGYETQAEICLKNSGFCHVRTRQWFERHCLIFNHAWKVSLFEAKPVTSFTSFNPWK